MVLAVVGLENIAPNVQYEPENQLRRNDDFAKLLEVEFVIYPVWVLRIRAVDCCVCAC